MAKSQRKGRKKVELEFESTPGRLVTVAGTFNDWDPDKKILKEVDEQGHYQATLMLPKGRHEYKFLIDGNWCTDPKNPHCVPNDQGSYNNVLVIQ